MTGRTLGHYEIHEKLGEGGMGVVFKARDTQLQRFAAVKVLPAGRTGDADGRARLIQEARSASALNHPNIVTVYEVSTEGDDLYIAMELVDGKPLGQLIPASGMRIKTATDIAIQVANALATAHGAKLVHRDLKPGNIMVTTGGSVKLLDFGLAKFMAALKPEDATLTVAQGAHDHSIVGTVPYMSPEQAEGKPIDVRSDIFSFGAVLYEMLSGQPAFPGNSVASTLAAVLDKDPPALRDGIPRTLRSIVSRCLRKDPAQRYQHAGDLRILLEDALADAGPGHIENARRESGVPGRRFRWWYLGAVAAILLIGGIVWNLRQQPVPETNLQLKRLTGDEGLTVGAAISPDGRLIAYASDRAGNGDLDIWVQHRAGGDPIRITHTSSDEFDPAFSTDGSQLIYAGRGGIYLVPALGGEPRRLAQAGVRPRLSPDGKRVIYQNSPTVRYFSRIFLLDIESGQQQPLPKDLPLARYPVWSPDGKSLLIETVDFSNKSQGEAAWRILSLDTQKSVNIGTSPGIPLQWLPGHRILFRTAGVNRQTLDESHLNSLGIVRISAARGRFANDPQRLSDGTGVIESGSVATDGTLVVALDSYRANLWDLPFNTGKAIGSVQALTKDVGLTAYPSISSDGKRLAFSSDLDGDAKIWLMDLATGERRKLTPLGGEENYPALSPDGTKVAYISRSKTGLSAIMAVDVTSFDQPGAPKNACPQGCMVPWAWWPDNRGVLVTMVDTKVIGGVKPEGGVREFLKANTPLYQSHPSPDGQWMLILRGGLWLARLDKGSMPDQSQWKPLQGPGKSDLPRWSADGNTIYFVSGRDNFRCIYGQHLNPSSKEPAGEVFPVYHSHRARVSMGGLLDTGAVGLAVASNRIVFAQAERSGNLWIGKLEPK